jgi:Carboxypeptidase regulatory-like domain
MKRACCFLALLVGAALAVAQQPAVERRSGKPSEKASIAGTVTRKRSDEPLKKAQVALSPADGRGPMYGAVTDAGGRFEIVGIEPGQYRLWVTRNGYLRQNYGQRSPGRAGTTLALAAGQRLRDLDFHLTPAGVVTGRVVDEDNEPIANARVQALQLHYYDARRRLVPAGTAGTNDLGEYRLFGLPPGRYYISATYRPGYAALVGMSALVRQHAAAAAQKESYVPKYYPGTSDASRAARVHVAAGAETQGMSEVEGDSCRSKVRHRISGGVRENVQNTTSNLCDRRLWLREDCAEASADVAVFPLEP